MRKTLSVGLFLLGGIVIWSGLAFGGLLSVSADTGDENRLFVDASALPGGDGSRERPFSDIHSIMVALENPNNTKSEVWMSGTFTEPFMLNPEMSGTPESPLVIKQWDGEEQTFIDTSLLPNASAISYNGANYITIDGLHAQAGGDDTGSLPIFVNSSTGAVVRNGRFFGGGESGTCLSFSTNVTIENNIFEDNEGNGILVPSVTGAVIRNNIIRRNASQSFSAGIFINASTDIVIEGNTIENSKTDGIFAPGVGNITIEGNDIIGNMYSGVALWGVNGVGNIVNNRIVGNVRNGLYMDSMNPATVNIAGNVLANNGAGGAYFRVAPNTVTFNIANNSFLANTSYGLSLDQDQGYVNLYNNIILGHNVGAQIMTKRTDRIQSDYNDLFANDENIQFRSNAQEPWKGWDDWKTLGKDGRSMRKDPKFTAELTCIGDSGVCLNYHLSASSPLLNVGKRIGNALTTDIDGETRTYNRIDIGADEYLPSL